MLYPVRNKYRNVLDLSGLWKFKIDPEKTGEQEKWFNGFESENDVAVPGSWNEQLEEIGLLHYIGSAWYYKKTYIPIEYTGKKIWLRIGSADYNCKVWVNGKFAGENNLGFLPFEFDISNFVIPGSESVIVVLISNELGPETIPQGISCENYLKENRIREETNPPARFDFSPFGGIHRPVQLIYTPQKFIDYINTKTKIISETKALVEFSIRANGIKSGAVKVELRDDKNIFTGYNGLVNGKANIKIEMENCKFWSPENPYLYDANVHLLDGDEEIDAYSLPVGIREIKIAGNKLLINNKEVYLKGFGKHEDYSIIGKGIFLPLMVKDFELLKWINANSFRTSHYPYAEEVMFYADKKGILIIDEVPAVSLDLRFATGKTLNNHKEFITRLLERDGNHPSVIMWSLGNEPNLVGAEGYYKGEGRKYWKEIFEYARSLDSSRLLTVPNCTRAGLEDPVFEFSDVLSINRYYGWYEHPGQLEFAAERISKEMDELFNKYNKPVLFTEFGADTLPGEHSTSVQMFTEEYQVKFLEVYINVIRSKSYTIGEHVWNFADFRTPQHFRRVVLNLKGVFTRERSPKSAAFKLKEIWSK